MMVSDTASLRKATEAECCISGGVAIHAQKLAHVEAFFKGGQGLATLKQFSLP